MFPKALWFSPTHLFCVVIRKYIAHMLVIYGPAVLRGMPFMFTVPFKSFRRRKEERSAGPVPDGLWTGTGYRSKVRGLGTPACNF